MASPLVTSACGRHRSVQPHEKKKPLVPRVICGSIVKNVWLLRLSLVNDCCVLPVYSFSSMSQHQMRRISLTHITKISSSLLGLIGFYTICPGKNDKFNDAHNSSLSHHCGVHVIMKQPETYSPRPYKLILQRKKVDVTQRKTLLEAKPKISKGLSTLSGRVLFPAFRYKNGGVFTRLVPFLTNWELWRLAPFLTNWELLHTGTRYLIKCPNFGVVCSHPSEYRTRSPCPSTNCERCLSFAVFGVNECFTRFSKQPIIYSCYTTRYVLGSVF